MPTTTPSSVTRVLTNAGFTVFNELTDGIKIAKDINGGVRVEYLMSNSVVQDTEVVMSKIRQMTPVLEAAGYRVVDKVAGVPTIFLKVFKDELRG